MFVFGLVVGIGVTLTVQTIGKALGLWGKRQIVGKDSVDQTKI
jgi:hypothetical protein